MYYRIIRDDNVIIAEHETLTSCMNDMLTMRNIKCKWYPSENHPTDVIVMQNSNGTFYKIQQIRPVDV